MRRALITTRPFLILSASVVLAASLLCPTRAPAQEACSDTVGRFVSVSGSVDLQRRSGGEWLAANLDRQLCEGDTIRVGERSRAAVALINEAVLRIDESTTVRLTDITGKKEERSWLDLIKGAFQSFSRKPRFLTVNTPYLNGAIEGTEFLARVDAKATEITVFEGVVLASNDQGEVQLNSGESARAAAGAAPQRRILVRPRDQVQWSLYYPPILSAASVADSPALEAAASCAFRGDTVCAFAALDKVPAAKRDANFHLLRASVLLSVGRVAEARADIDEALRRDPGFGQAYALRSVIEVTQNQRDKALADARRGVELSPTSAAAKIALSYALQSEFQIEAARDTMQSAVKQHPDDALAWARLAELELMLGRPADALATSQKATSKAPGLSRAQLALGFSALASLHFEEAKAAFERAIALDSADPLAHLGLGLVTIRLGKLEEGTGELEASVALDSSDALLRAYLGKAYYEEKRRPLDAEQYSIAKQLDPNDPTAYFYDAIEKQTTNRPVEALREMQKAIELNDDRAVYRSRLLLDSDLAMRSAALARIYTDLGFQQRGLVEGWKSVNTDPSNYSAHRFLADIYSVLPRHEIARVSELLQSQLLQPINTTPIQPRLGESNLLLISALGPAAIAFNEFNPVFMRNGLTFQASGIAGENGTQGFEGIVSGIYDKLSYSAGGFHFKTDGFRDNADQDDTIASLFAQYELGPSTSIQAEYRYRDAEYGDLRLKFFPHSVFPAKRYTLQNDTWRLGARHDLSPRSTVLASFTYQEGSFRDRDEPWPQPGVLVSDLNQPDQSAVGGELQYLFRSPAVDLVTGGGYFDVSDEWEQFVRFGVPFIPGPPFTPETIDITGTIDLDLQHGNAYAYSYVNPLENLTLTVGASYDSVDSKFLNEVKEQVNPKLGIMWSPLPGTTVRAAAFRALKRTLITQQTLEPTQVAGFNQFFDDHELTESWRYGAAVDQKFSTSLFGGLEYSKRDLKVPYIDFTVDVESPPTVESDWDEYLGRAYLFWAPHEWLALRAEYLYEKLKRQEPFVEGVIDAKTHRVPLGVNFFLPSGLSASLTATYFNQEGKFGGYYNTDPIEQGNSDFWTVDLAVNYRLPKRYGFLTVGATNLFDEDFQFFDSDLNNASIQPGRMIFASVTLALP